MPEDVRIPTAAAYDEIVEDFVRRTSAVPDDLLELRDRFAGMLPDGGRVVDLGCGPGRDLAALTAAGLWAVGLDASVEMTRRVKAASIPVARADMRALPLRAASVDGIWSMASLLHVPRPAVAPALRGWHEVLRPNGVLGLSTSVGEGEGWEDCPYDPAAPRSPTSLRRWFVHHTADGLRTLLDDAGFEIELARERVTNRHWFQVLARRCYEGSKT